LFIKYCLLSFFAGDSSIFPLLDPSILAAAASANAGSGGHRSDPDDSMDGSSSAMNKSNEEGNANKYSCARCGRSYLHQGNQAT